MVLFVFFGLLWSCFVVVVFLSYNGLVCFLSAVMVLYVFFRL